MMSFSACVTGFFMNFGLLPILTDYANWKKGGMKLKKISSPLKLLSQFQPNFAEMILRWSPGGHLGYRTALTDTILKGDHLRIISAKFG
jgi:hypothetical protein